MAGLDPAKIGMLQGFADRRGEVCFRRGDERAAILLHAVPGISSMPSISWMSTP